MRLIYSSAYVTDIGEHSFATRKFALTAEMVRDLGEIVEPPEPDEADLLLAHSPDWVAKVRSGRMTLEDELLLELPFSPEVARAHRLQAAGTLLACKEALEEGVGFHIGGGSHHAFRDHGEGFCVVNDLACALLRLFVEGRVRRAAVVDLDVHQGNGTASILGGDHRAFTFSMHQEDLYPRVKVAGSLDVGMPAGTGDVAYLALLEESLPKAFASGPDLILYQAGVDGHEGDLLGGLRLTAEGLRRRDHMVFEAARRRGVPVAVTLGGGYSRNPAEAAGLHAQTVLAGADAIIRGHASHI